MAAVCVWPGMEPATISEAPNSPMARAKASSVPARMPGQASGSVTRKNTPQRDCRKVRAAASNSGSTCASAVLAAFNTKGNATRVEASTAPCQWKISE